MLGYTVSDCSDIIWDDAEFITESQTEGEDSNGYAGQETLGVARYDDMLCLFRGSTDRQQFEKCETIILSPSGEKLLSAVLYELATELTAIGL